MLNWEVRSLSSNDCFDDVHGFSKGSPRILNYCFSIGERGNKGADYFYVSVANPEWLKLQIEKDGPFLMSKIIFADSFDSEEIKYKVIDEIKRKEPFENWEEFASKMSYLLAWEMDGTRFRGHDVK